MIHYFNCSKVNSVGANLSVMMDVWANKDSYQQTTVKLNCWLAFYESAPSHDNAIARSSGRHTRQITTKIPNTFSTRTIQKEKPAKTDWLFFEDYTKRKRNVKTERRNGCSSRTMQRSSCGREQGAAVLLPMKAAHVDGSPGRLFLIPPSSEFWLFKGRPFVKSAPSSWAMPFVGRRRGARGRVDACLYIAVTAGILSPRQLTLNRPVAALRVQGRPWLIPNLPLPPYHYSSNWNVPGWFLGSFSWLSEGQSPYQDSIWHTKKCPKVHVWQMEELFGQCWNERGVFLFVSQSSLEHFHSFPCSYKNLGLFVDIFWNTSFSPLVAISIVGFLFQPRDELIGKQAKTVEDEGGLFLPTDYSGPLSPHRPISLSDRSRPLNRAALQKIWICHSCCCWCGRTENQGQKSNFPDNNAEI